MKQINSYLTFNGNRRESNENKHADDFLSMLAVPARRALQQIGISMVRILRTIAVLNLYTNTTVNI